MNQSRDTSSRRLASAVAVAATAFALTSTALAQDANTLRYATITEPAGLALQSSVSPASQIPLQALYEPLMHLDQNMQLVPHLAESFEQIDDKTYVLKLRSGITFHSGNPLTASDVKETFAWHLNPDQPGFATDYLAPIAEMIVKDELTLEIRLKTPYGPFPYIMTMPHLSIGDMKKYAEVGMKGLNKQPSGTGPFMYESWDRGAELVFKANPNYWGGEVPIERIKFRFMPEAATRSIALETGEIDLAESVAAADIERLIANPDINVVDAWELRAVLWVINTRHKVLSDMAVRKALAHAIDYKLAIDTVLGRAARAMGGFVPKGTFGYADFDYAYDSEKARGILEDAGWKKGSSGFYEKDGQRLAFTHVSGAHIAQEVKVAEAIQALFREFGVDMKIEVMDRIVHSTTMFDYAIDSSKANSPVPNFGTTQWDHGIRTGDAAVELDPLFTCGGERNFGHFCDPAYDKLILKAVSGIPAEERQAAFADAQKILFDKVAAFPLWQPRIAIAYNRALKGVQPTATKMLYYEQLSFDR